MLFYLLVAIVFAFSTTEAISSVHPLSDEFIAQINSKQSMWTAGRNFHRDRPLIYFKRLMGTLRDNGIDYLPKKRYISHSKLPKHFDARQKWPGCPSLNHIRDQGSCGSCWAVAAVSAMTDRICISSNGSKNFYFSEDDVLSCCRNCGAGCEFGILRKAWTYTMETGTVSGGSYNSNQGCKPYEIAPCAHDVPGTGRPQCGRVLEPLCKESCESNYGKYYTDDKTFIKIVYNIKGMHAIKRDIFNYGPVTTSFVAYTDFLSYKSGVYRHLSGEYMGEHSVKLLGWGVEKGYEYWLAANSWNTDWGDNGFFKILAGNNHCGIEKYVIAGHP